MRLVVGILVLLIAVGCTNPKEYELAPDPKSWGADEDLKKAVGELSPEDKKLFAAYMVRAAMADAFGHQGSKKTIGVAIDEEREWEAKQAAEAAEAKRLEAEAKALAEEAEKKRAEVRKQLSDALAVTIATMEFRESDFRKRIISDHWKLTIAGKNKGSKPITAFKGTFHFADSFGDEIKTVSISQDAEFPPGEVVTLEADLEHNQFMPADKKLQSVQFEKLKITYEPIAVIFADGTKLDVPE